MNPQKIGRYIIKDPLGQGGMATVYRAEDPHFRREVAIKVLPRELISKATFRARFDREARIIFTASNTLMTTDPDWSTPLELGTVARNSCSSPAATLTGASYNLYYGNFCGIGSSGTGVCRSPNGAYEVITNWLSGEHSIVVRETGAEDLIFIYQGPVDMGEGIRWSPLSESFLFVVGDTVNRAFLNGTYNQILYPAYTPIFSPDGSLILFLKPVGPGVNDVFVSNNDGTMVRNVTNVTIVDKRCPAWRN